MLLHYRCDKMSHGPVPVGLIASPVMRVVRNERLMPTGMAWRLAAVEASRAGSRGIPVLTAATIIERIKLFGAEGVAALVAEPAPHDG